MNQQWANIIRAFLVYSGQTTPDGRRIPVLGCAPPSPPCSPGTVCYYTLVLDPDQDEAPREERNAMSRRSWHLTTDIFGDDEADYQAELESSKSPVNRN